MKINNNIVSVKELNKVLNNEHFSGNYSDVDIVFVAGLFLWYMQHKENWKKIPRSFSLTENENVWNHSHYFKQIEDLYGVKHSHIFDNFPNASNISANSASRFFAPPIYITNKSIHYFFGTEKTHFRIDNLKTEYINLFDLSDFVDKKFKTYKNSIKDFEKYSLEIHQSLKNSSPIFVLMIT